MKKESSPVVADFSNPTKIQCKCPVCNVHLVDIFLPQGLGCVANLLNVVSESHNCRVVKKNEIPNL